MYEQFDSVMAEKYRIVDIVEKIEAGIYPIVFVTLFMVAMSTSNFKMTHICVMTIIGQQYFLLVIEFFVS